MATVSVKVPVEIDITYVNKTWYSLRKQNNVKQYVIGFYQREGKAVIKVIPNNDQETIELIIIETVSEGSILYAEENIIPRTLDDMYEIYELKSTEGERAVGDMHVNNVKNIWRDLKRLLKMTHIHVSKKHLQGYCTEVVWRINNKNLTSEEKFNLLLSNCAVKDRKCSYKNLIK